MAITEKMTNLINEFQLYHYKKLGLYINPNHSIILCEKENLESLLQSQRFPAKLEQFKIPDDWRDLDDDRIYVCNDPSLIWKGSLGIIAAIQTTIGEYIPYKQVRLHPASRYTSPQPLLIVFDSFILFLAPYEDFN
ncbi:MAG: hypothetical protein ACFFDT_00320 [Candidatus Hodarchaeota archaeon]